MKAWFLALSLGKKVAFSTAALLTTLTVVGATAPPPEPVEQVNPGQSEQTESQVEVKKVTEKVPIGFEVSQIEDASLQKGKKVTRTDGKKGERTVVYEVTYSDGIEVSRKKISDKITTKPINKVVAVGTYEAPQSATVSCNNATHYINSAGNCIQRPGAHPAGATARCRDGTYSYSQNRRGTCSHHGGVAQWL